MTSKQRDYLVEYAKRYGLRSTVEFAMAKHELDRPEAEKEVELSLRMSRGFEMLLRDIGVMR